MQSNRDPENLPVYIASGSRQTKSTAHQAALSATRKEERKNEKEKKSILYITPVPLLGRLFAFVLIFMALLYLSIVKEKSRKLLSSYEVV